MTHRFLGHLRRPTICIICSDLSGSFFFFKKSFLLPLSAYHSSGDMHFSLQILQVNRTWDFMWTNRITNRCTGHTCLKQYFEFLTACACLSLSSASPHQTTWRLIPPTGSGPTVSRAHAHRTWRPNLGKLWRRAMRWPSASWCGTTHAISLAQVIIPLLCRWGQVNFLVYSVSDCLFIATFWTSILKQVAKWRGSIVWACCIITVVVSQTVWNLFVINREV